MDVFDLLRRRDLNRLNVQDILSNPYRMQRSRSRSRSRTSTKTRRSIARSRSVPALRMVRNLGYTGQCQLARSVVMSVPITGVGGFTLAGQNYSDATFTFSPQYLRLRGDSTHELTALIPQAAELAAVWERVRIDKVELTITSNLTDSSVPQTGTTPVTNASPRIVLANDWNGPNSGGSVGNISNVLQETDAQLYHIGGDLKPVQWTIYKPKYNRLVQFTDAESAYEPSVGFVESISDIQHNGVRIGLADLASVYGCRMLVFAKFYFTFKNVH